MVLHVRAFCEDVNRTSLEVNFGKYTVAYFFPNCTVWGLNALDLTHPMIFPHSDHF